MKYPLDVQRSTSEASRVVGKEKTKFILMMVVLANVIIAFIVIPFCASLGIKWYFPLTVQLLLCGLLSFFVFRIFIFKEDEKLREHRSQLSDSFSKYYFFRNLEAGDKISLPDVEIPIYEFDNGSHTVILRMRSGSNDNTKSQNTKEAMQQVYRLLSLSGLEYREFVGTEDFSESPEARLLMYRMSRIEDKKLARCMMDITQGVLEIAESRSNVDVRYLQIKTKFNYQKYELESVLYTVYRTLTTSYTCFRSIEFLDKKGVLEFLREFYNLEAIDLSMMKVRAVEDIEEIYSPLVQVYEIISSDGRVLSREDDPIGKAMPIPRRIN